MPESSAIDRFKQLETHEKVTVILELLRAYKDIDDNDIKRCKKRLARAFAWWGISTDIIATTLLKQIENDQLGHVKNDLFKITVTLIYILSPSENIESFLDV